MLGFLCNSHWHHADLVKGSKVRFSLDIRVVRVSCSRRIQPEIVLEPLLANFDGVLVFECLPGNCRYTEASDYHGLRFQEVVAVLDASYIQRDRLCLDRVPTRKTAELSTLTAKFAEKIRNLGRLHLNKTARHRLRRAQNNFKARRIREFVTSGLIQVNGEKTKGRGIHQSWRAAAYEEYVMNWLSVLIEEGPTTLKQMNEVMDIGEEQISRYLLDMEKERRIRIPAELRREIVIWQTKESSPST